MRKLTKLENEAVMLLLQEATEYLSGDKEYGLRPDPYYHGMFVARRGASNLDGTIAGVFALTQHNTKNGDPLLHLSLCFDRPSRDWTVTARLDNVRETSQIGQITIAKEYHGKGNGQYLIAERTANGWAITASEYD